MKEKILEYCKKTYHTNLEFPWKKYPEYMVFRHEDNKKWYALVMCIDGIKLDRPASKDLWIINLKCDPFFMDILKQQEGYYPAYHMNKANWISVLLDGTVSMDQICNLIDDSYDMTMSAKERRNDRRYGPKAWLVPSNPRYFNLIQAYEQDDVVIWKQGNDSMQVGDYVYFYLGSPYSAILYQGVIIENNLPFESEFKPVNIKKVMKVKRIHTFDKEELSLDRIRKLGVYSVRAARGVPDELQKEIERLIFMQER